MFKPVRGGDVKAITRFLDSETLILRWLVAFFKHFDRLPSESVPYWAFWADWRDGKSAAAGGEVLSVVAHSFHTGAAYLASGTSLDAAAVEKLLRAELLPERLTADRATLERCLDRAPAISQGIIRQERVKVLALEPKADRGNGTGPQAGFRPAQLDDVPVLKQYERAYGLEMKEDIESDFESLIAAKLVFVLERDGKIQATMRANLSDGKYVHLGGLYVAPPFRGQGLGKKLVLALAHQIHREERVAVLLDVLDSNRVAFNLYRQVGFQEIGEAQTIHFQEAFWKG